MSEEHPVRSGFDCSPMSHRFHSDCGLGKTDPLVAVEQKRIDQRDDRMVNEGQLGVEDLGKDPEVGEEQFEFHKRFRTLEYRVEGPGNHRGPFRIEDMRTEGIQLRELPARTHRIAAGRVHRN